MSALEREILEKFHQLTPVEKRRIHNVMKTELDAEETAFNYATWNQSILRLRQEMGASATQGIDVVSILRDIRDGIDE